MSGVRLTDGESVALYRAMHALQQLRHTHLAGDAVLVFDVGMRGIYRALGVDTPLRCVLCRLYCPPKALDSHAVCPACKETPAT